MLRDKISSELKNSLKNQDKTRLSTIRLIVAALKAKDIDARGKKSITDEDILTLLQGMIKQRRESLELYIKGCRKELADKEQDEIDVIQSFLPPPLTEEEVDLAINKALLECGAKTIKEMGQVMSYLKDNFAGRIDFSKIAGKIREKLGN